MRVALFRALGFIRDRAGLSCEGEELDPLHSIEAGFRAY